MTITQTDLARRSNGKAAGGRPVQLGICKLAQAFGWLRASDFVLTCPLGNIDLLLLQEFRSFVDRSSLSKPQLNAGLCSLQSANT
jgi:hypothetical protein